MRTIVSLPLALLSFGIAAGLYGSETSSANSASTTTANTFANVETSIASQPPVGAEAESEPAPSMPEPNPALTKYLEDSLLSWLQIPSCDTEGKSAQDAARATARCAAWEKNEHESVEHNRERVHGFAVAMSQAAAVEQSPWANDALHARMAEFVLSLGFMESRYREYVDDGRCDDKQWQKTPEGQYLIHLGGHCDGTLASSPWQIHTEHGILLLDPNKDQNRDWVHVWDAKVFGLSDEVKRISEQLDPTLPAGFGHLATAEGIRGATPESRLLGARTAWHMARQALRYSKMENIRAYTGEWGGPCPKSDARMEFAAHWWEKHPFTLPQE